MNKDKTKIILMQLLTIVLVLISFLIISKYFDSLKSFLVAICVYWLFLIIQLAFIDQPKISIKIKIKNVLNRSNNLLLSLVCFIPTILVFFVAFIPISNTINIRLLLISIMVGAINGIIEEIYWRGLVYKLGNYLFLFFVTILFSLNHASFLFLDFIYQGGAINLIGGPLFMGIIWIIIAKKTNTIKYGIIAHQFVNIFAFYSLFINNHIGLINSNSMYIENIKENIFFG